jgi:hypothetical protein
MQRETSKNGYGRCSVFISAADPTNTTKRLISIRPVSVTFGIAVIYLEERRGSRWVSVGRGVDGKEKV